MLICTDCELTFEHSISRKHPSHTALTYKITIAHIALFARLEYHTNAWTSNPREALFHVLRG